MSKRPPRVVKDASGAEVSGYLAAKAQGIAQGLGPLKRPDAIVGSRAPYDIFDAKFPCSSKVKSGRVDAVNLSARGKGGAGMMSPAQRRSYQRIAKGTSKRPGSVTAVSPADARDAKC